MRSHSRSTTPSSLQSSSHESSSHESSSLASGSTARPVHEIRLGRIRAAIWENENERGTMHRVSVSKSYRAGEEWKETSSFFRDDLPFVAKAIDLCHTWIYETEAAARHPR